MTTLEDFTAAARAKAIADRKEQVQAARQRQRALTYGRGNAKLHKGIATFSLPAGYTCPQAHACLARAARATGKITDGQHTQFRCFAASQEATYPNVRRARWSNFEALAACGGDFHELAGLICPTLPREDIIRLHVSGDFYSQAYFDAWVYVASKVPQKIFYAYTKSLAFWVARLGELPPNLRLTASRGGYQDALIDAHGLKCAEVVFSEAEAQAKGLPIDHDDTHAYLSPRSFALLLHGVQPKGSPAASALKALKGQGSYRRAR
jgi:hypothetical protein